MSVRTFDGLMRSPFHSSVTNDAPRWLPKIRRSGQHLDRLRAFVLVHASLLNEVAVSQLDVRVHVVAARRTDDRHHEGRESLVAFTYSSQFRNTAVMCGG
jgi:hypothetical protein